MTVGKLRDALTRFNRDMPVRIQGTSVPVTPRDVEVLSILRARPDDDRPPYLWAFEHDDDATVIILTE